MRRHVVLVIACMFLGAGFCSLSKSSASDWSRVRGPSGSGLVAGTIPDELNLDKNLLWKAESGKGASSPVVIGNRVFLTAFAGDERRVECFDATSGAQLW